MSGMDATDPLSLFAAEKASTKAVTRDKALLNELLEHEEVATRRTKRKAARSSRSGNNADSPRSSGDSSSSRHRSSGSLPAAGAAGTHTSRSKSSRHSSRYSSSSLNSSGGGSGGSGSSKTKSRSPNARRSLGSRSVSSYDSLTQVQQMTSSSSRRAPSSHSHASSSSSSSSSSSRSSRSHPSSHSSRSHSEVPSSSHHSHRERTSRGRSHTRNASSGGGSGHNGSSSPNGGGDSSKGGDDASATSADGGGGYFMSDDDESRGTLVGEKLVMRLAVRYLNLSLNEAIHGTLVMTNYQLFFEPTAAHSRATMASTSSSSTSSSSSKTKDAARQHGFDAHTTHCPLASIERIEQVGQEKNDKSVYALDVYTRQLRLFRFLFDHHSDQRNRAFHVLVQFVFPQQNHLLFAYSHLQGRTFPPEVDGWKIYDANSEFVRMGLPSKAYRRTTINAQYVLCETYPRLLVVPAKFKDDDLWKVASFRKRGRIPVLTWKHPVSNASIWRCSQPKVGLSMRSTEDEHFLRLITQANNDNDTLYIMDARPKLNANFNRIGGAGYELTQHYGQCQIRSTEDELLFKYINDVNTENDIVFIMDLRPKVNANMNRLAGAGYELQQHYNQCRIRFLNIENIHVMRDAYQKLGKVLNNPKVTDSADFYAQVEATNHLKHVRLVLQACLEMVTIIDRHKASIVSHCSDGWDRTSQLCSLTELCLDPYYRTQIGFIVLIEKEWLSYGHQFQVRTGYGDKNYNDVQRSPIFHQFIEAVWNLTEQFPTSFEFTSSFLVTILDHLSSCRFGTFLFNSEKVRRQEKLSQKTVSLWTYIRSCPSKDQFINPFYNPRSAGPVLYPTYSPKKVTIWHDYFLRWFNHEALHGGIGQGSIPPFGATPATLCSKDAVLHKQARRQNRKIRELQSILLRMERERQQHRKEQAAAAMEKAAASSISPRSRSEKASSSTTAAAASPSGGAFRGSGGEPPRSLATIERASSSAASSKAKSAASLSSSASASSLFEDDDERESEDPSEDAKSGRGRRRDTGESGEPAVADGSDNDSSKAARPSSLSSPSISSEERPASVASGDSNSRGSSSGGSGSGSGGNSSAVARESHANSRDSGSGSLDEELQPLEWHTGTTPRSSPPSTLSRDKKPASSGGSSSDSGPKSASSGEEEADGKVGLSTALESLLDKDQSNVDSSELNGADDHTDGASPAADAVSEEAATPPKEGTEPAAAQTATAPSDDQPEHPPPADQDNAGSAASPAAAAAADGSSACSSAAGDDGNNADGAS